MNSIGRLLFTTSDLKFIGSFLIFPFFSLALKILIILWIWTTFPSSAFASTRYAVSFPYPAIEILDSELPTTQLLLTQCTTGNSSSEIRCIPSLYEEALIEDTKIINQKAWLSLWANFTQLIIFHTFCILLTFLFSFGL